MASKVYLAVDIGVEMREVVCNSTDARRYEPATWNETTNRFLRVRQGLG
jgi:hypothetical protein